jgi:hypothetical protein
VRLRFRAAAAAAAAPQAFGRFKLVTSHCRHGPLGRHASAARPRPTVTVTAGAANTADRPGGYYKFPEPESDSVKTILG